MGLFGPDWKTKTASKSEKSIENVKQITDPDALFKISITAPLEEVRCAAVRKIHDQKLLKKVLLYTWTEMAKRIGCPIDLEESKDNIKGLDYTGTDVATGKSYTAVLPCGAALPPRAVCMCNCFAGGGGCSPAN